MNKKNLKDILQIVKTLTILYAVYLAIAWVFETFFQPSSATESEWMTYTILLIIFLVCIWGGGRKDDKSN